MTILGKISNTVEDNEKQQDGFVVPRLYRKKEEGLSFKSSVILSCLLHPASVALVWLLVIILALLGVNFDRLSKPQTPQRDIEFVLVNNPEAQPINKNTKNRADRNTRAGGKHDPKKPEIEPSPAPGAPSKPAQQVSKPVQQPKAQPQKQVQPKPQPKPQPVAQPVSKPVEQPAPKNVTPQPTPPVPKPAPVVSAPKVVETPKSAMQIPVPKTTAPKLAGSYGGPVIGTKSGVGSTTTGSSSSATSRPAPSFTPSSGSSTAGSAGRFSSGQYGNGQAGNPSPGNPNGAPGIDAIKEPDFGPYMRELQRRIKMNWDPPKGDESKRVVLMFKIARDGRLLSCRVSRSSGIQAADRAAMSAVELTAPFKPLPPEFKGQSVDIQFTFDYNVFGASRY